MQYTLLHSFFTGLRPEPRLTVSEWSDQFRYLDSKAAAEPGLYRTSRTPYLKKPMDALSVTNPVKKVIFMKAAQVGATELGNNWMGYIIDNAPGPILAVQPTDEMVKRNSKMRIAPMIEATPRLREKIKPARAKDSGNTITQKEFPGGVLIMTGANSAVGLRSMPARFVMLDETDGYPLDVDGEGSPVALAEKRTSTFSNKKILLISTPTIEGQSIIEAEFKTTEQQYYFVPCPHCGGMQVLNFQQLKWEPLKYDTAVYVCEHCNENIQERFKPEMLKNGIWQATVPEKENTYTVGFHISAMYSPFGWKSWAEIAEEWEKAQGDDNKLKTFYNTVLGETWKEKTEAPQWELLYERAEDFGTKVMNDVVFITAGVDVQADRIELEIVGWMEGKKSQSIDFRVLDGETDRADVWKKLDEVLSELFIKEDGSALPIRLLAIDTGYNTHKVYDWAKKHGIRRVIPIKGSESLENFFTPPKVVDINKHGQKIGKTKVWFVGSSFIKTEVYSFLRQLKDHENGTVPDGYCYFPKRDPHYFKGLTAEVVQLVRNTRGYIKRVWAKVYQRNEPLDCRVYARAAAAIVGMDRWNEARWQRERSNVEKPPPPPVQKSESKKAPAKKAKSKSNFWKR